MKNILLMVLMLGFGAIAFASSESAVDDYKHQLERKWLLEVYSQPIAKTKDIEKVLDLADRTLEYVQQEKKLPELAKLLKGLHNEWSAKKISPAQYNDFYIKVRHLRREIILSHPKLDFEKIMINQVPPTKYSHNGDQNLAQHSVADGGWPKRASSKARTTDDSGN